MFKALQYQDILYREEIFIDLIHVLLPNIFAPNYKEWIT